MKLFKLIFILCIVSSFFIFAVPGHTQVDTESKELIQVVLVLDVSQSMEEIVPQKDLPQDLTDVMEQIDAIENDEKLKKVYEQIDGIVNNPEVVGQREKWEETIKDLDEWLFEKEYGENQKAIIGQISEILSGLGYLQLAGFRI